MPTCYSHLYDYLMYTGLIWDLYQDDIILFHFYYNDANHPDFTFTFKKITSKLFLTYKGNPCVYASFGYDVPRIACRCS